MDAREASREAKAGIEGKSPTLQQKILAHLKEMQATGATDEEMQIALEMAPNTQRPRRKELEQALQVFNSGRTRKTKSNRNAVVWIHKDQFYREQTQMTMFDTKGST